LLDWQTFPEPWPPCAQIPKPVIAVVFLYPIKDTTEAFREEEAKRIATAGQEVSPKVFYTKQVSLNVARDASPSRSSRATVCASRRLLPIADRRERVRHHRPPARRRKRLGAHRWRRPAE